MTCPDCVGTLVEISLSGIDKSYRCFRCGGNWVKESTLNELSVKALEDWKPMQFDNAVLLAGGNRCPNDGIELKSYKSLKVPESWNVRKCETCKGWWWATDTLFRVKEVIKKDSGYLRVGEIVKDEVS